MYVCNVNSMVKISSLECNFCRAVQLENRKAVAVLLRHGADVNQVDQRYDLCSSAIALTSRNRADLNQVTIATGLMLSNIANVSQVIQPKS
jgi:hypothetical protein